MFDADGNFIRTFGKAGDGPGYFARPKGIASTAMATSGSPTACRTGCRSSPQKGQLLIYMGGHGLLPGQFQSLVNLTIDKNNRVFTTEQFPGRMQMFRYVTKAEAKAEKERRDAEAEKEGESDWRPRCGESEGRRRRRSNWRTSLAVRFWQS